MSADSNDGRGPAGSDFALSSEENGLIDVVELGLDWRLPITDEQFKEYQRLVEKRKRLEEARRQQSEEGVEEAVRDCEGQRPREGMEKADRDCQGQQSGENAEMEDRDCQGQQLGAIR